MNDVLISFWNSIVKETDTIYHLGDFCFGNRKQHENLVQRLNGYKVLILGNHDRSAKFHMDTGWDEAKKWDILETPFGNVLLTHDARIPDHPNINETIDLKLHLCGHEHNSWRVKIDRAVPVVNLSVENWDYKPVNLLEVIPKVLAENDVHRQRRAMERT